jgi:C1A family cysteine protease
MTSKTHKASLDTLKAMSIDGQEFLVEPLDPMIAGLKSLKTRRARLQIKPQGISSRAVPPAVHSLTAHQTPFRNQGGRGTCWAFAGIAALEAAYKRKYGVGLDLSEHYIFHMSKCMELYGDYMTNSVRHENNSSNWGFQGNSGIIELMSRVAIPEERFAPYLDDPQMNELKRNLPGAGDLSWESTQEQLDVFEYDERHIPLEARHRAKYKVKSWGVIGNLSIDRMEQVLANNCEIVIDVDAYKWRYNASTDNLEFDPNGAGGGGHVVLIVGYDRNQQVFFVKNSWNENRFLRITYDYIRRVSAQWYTGHYITDVEDINMPPQMKAKWIGRWNMDHDGWRGQLVIRRFTNFRVGENDPTKLGNYYRDGKRYETQVVPYKKS